MKVINIEQYNLDIKVFNSSRSLKRYTNRNRYHVEHDLKGVSGLALYYDHAGVDLLLYLPKEYNEEVVDHEIIHMTWFIGKAIGHPVNFSTQEFQTYLFSYIKNKVKKQVYGRG